MTSVRKLNGVLILFLLANNLVGCSARPLDVGFELARDRLPPQAVYQAHHSSLCEKSDWQRLDWPYTDRPPLLLILGERLFWLRYSQQYFPSDDKWVTEVWSLGDLFYDALEEMPWLAELAANQPEPIDSTPSRNAATLIEFPKVLEVEDLEAEKGSRAERGSGVID